MIKRILRVLGILLAAIVGLAALAALVVYAVSELNARLGIPKGLGTLGLAQDTVEKIADGALGDHCHQSTPRQPTKAEYVQLIEESWD